MDLEVNNEKTEITQSERYFIEIELQKDAGPNDFAFGNRDSDTAGSSRVMLPKSSTRGFWNWIAPLSSGYLFIRGAEKESSLLSSKTEAFYSSLRYYIGSFLNPLQIPAENQHNLKLN